jgi:hypothetical protein
MLAAVAGAAGADGIAGASSTYSKPGTAVMDAVNPAAQQAARSFWTASRMAAATPPASVVTAGPAVAGPPPGTPTATLFTGVPTVGALFFTTGTALHFCTASVVNSAALDLVLTAAHCVYFDGKATDNVEFVPGYHSGRRPFGAWVVKASFVAAGWKRSQDQNLDFAFLAVTPPPGRRQIQHVTGGLQLGINRPYQRPVEVIGYNTSASRPVECATHSFEFEPDQMEFLCHGYRDGTSGAPWIVRYDASNGTGLVIGIIGGFQLGGLAEWASYSSYFGRPAYLLYQQAQLPQKQ